MKKGKKYYTVTEFKGVDADLIFMRDAAPRVRRAGYLLYVLGTVLDSYASGLELLLPPKVFLWHKYFLMNIMIPPQ